MKNNNLALSSGCDAWILINNPDDFWWNEINFKMAFQLSSLAKDTGKEFSRSISNEAERILKETDFPKYNFKRNNKSNIIFIGSENNLPNKWICLLEKAEDINNSDLEQNLKNLKCSNIRLFFKIILSPSLKASYPQAQIISESQF